MDKLTHFSEAGRARMVDVSEKPAPSALPSPAVCCACRSPPERIRTGQVAKGDVLTVADVGAVMAAKRTPDIIPMCHSIALSGVEIEFSEIVEPDAQGCVGIKVVATASCVGQTGVEMEALCAANVALLTIYDMCKAIDRGMRIECVQLEEKRGGKSGVWKRGDSK